jgi:Cutinase
VSGRPSSTRCVPLGGGKSVALYAVDYPASYDFLRAVDGANDARHFVASTVASCPQTKLVLGGYSQGAAVVDLLTVPGQATFGFGDPLPNDIADHVAAVAVFGNPSTPGMLTWQRRRGAPRVPGIRDGNAGSAIRGRPTNGRSAPLSRP